MAEFTVRRDVRAPAERVWSVLTDWPAHGRWVALTTVRTTTPGPTGVGTEFVARTHLGRFGFDDSMRVTEWLAPTGTDPGRCTIVKTGRVVRGGATIVVTPHGPLCTVEWTERVDLPGLGRVPGVDLGAGLVGRAVFAGVVERMAGEIEGPARAEPTAPGPEVGG
jgi:Polyketide cyclase / dehydrase and lipid transport